MTQTESTESSTPEDPELRPSNLDSADASTSDAATRDSGSAAEADEYDPEAEMAWAEAAAPSEQLEVGLVRSVRYGRILVVGSVIGAVIAAIAALVFPVAPDATYELGQAVGFALVIGAAVGLTLGAILALILGSAAKRSRGAALAMHTDVR